MPTLVPRPSLIAAVRAARAKMTPAERALHDRALDDAHAHAAAILAGHPPIRPAAVPDLALVKSLIGEAPPLNFPEPGTAAALSAHVDASGVIWGTQQYENGDPGWATAYEKYLEYKDNKPAFAGGAPCITIPDQVLLGLIGDWGTGYWRGTATPAAKVAQQLTGLSPDYTIHIGDTYYAGTSDEMTANLVDIWPRGRSGSFAIPGNHEMYCSDWFYYAALPTLCPQQNGASYFALKNDNWLILVLDSAYYATGDLYMDGSISGSGPGEDSQAKWLFATLQAQAANRRILVMTHHQPVDLPGVTLQPLYDQVMTWFRLANCKLAAWYFGHEHNAAVYTMFSQMALPGRLIGHGGIPYGVASDLTGATGTSVQWAETQSANDADYPQRILNGFVTIALDGSKLAETFYSENGDVRWSGTL